MTDNAASGQTDKEAIRHGKRDRDNPIGDLEYLKMRWKALRPSMHTGIIAVEHQQLARETIQRLLCSKETIELLRFLESNDMAFAIKLINDTVSEIMSSPRNAELRASLMNLDGNTAKPKDGQRYCVQWSYEAGKGCSAEELEQFLSAMKDEDCILNAILGNNESLADSDPVRAVSLTLKALEGKAVGGFGVVSINEQVRKLPLDSNFAEIEQMFPLEFGDNKLSTSAVHEGRDALFRRWAMADPAAAANYVMEHSERIDPSRIQVIAGVVAKSDPVVGLDWAQNFPEGPYFDAAADSVIAYLHDTHPNESLQLASLISDPKIRERAIELISLSKKPGAHGR